MAAQADTVSGRTDRSRRRFFGGVAAIFLVTSAASTYGLVALVHYIPRTVVMATGSEGGGYSEFGEQYRVIAARQGVDMTVVQTSGSIKVRVSSTLAAFWRTHWAWPLTTVRAA
jgi:hypothetical protein